MIHFRTHQPGDRLLTVCLILVLVAVFLAPAAADASRPAGSEETQGATAGHPLGELLRADGTLDLNSGFRGSLDASGWRLAGKPGQALRFIPDAAPAAPGDEYWSPLGSGMNNAVSTLALDDAGPTVYAGGYFTMAGGVSANYIAKWDGTAWSALGSGMNGFVSALALDGAGPTVYAGGGFTTAGGVSARHIAKWDGTAWSPLGSGMGGGFGYEPFVFALAVDDAGPTVYAGGYFTEAGGVSATYIAKWNGKAWSPLGSGMNAWVFALTVDDAGNLYAGGNFSGAGGVSANCIAKWDGTAWSALGSGMVGPATRYADCVLALAADGAGYLYAGGSFWEAGGVSANSIAKWDGTAWSPLGSGIGGGEINYPWVSALAVDSAGNLYAGGGFTEAGGVAASAIARWEGTSWHFLGSGTGGQEWPSVHALALDGADSLYAGGYFSTAGDKPSRYIARWTRPNVVAPIEHPRAGAFVTGTVTLSGFAIDRTSANGTGIDRVDVYLDGPYGTGTIIGGATYGLDRPDVAAQYGARFGPSGWELAWDTSAIAPGVHTLIVYAHRTLDNRWSQIAPHVVVVRADHITWLPLGYRNR